VIKEFRTLGKHALIYGAGFVLARAVGFLLLPLYTRYLTPEDYGAIELLDLTGFVLATFMTFGMDQAVMKYYHAWSDQSDRNRVLSTSIHFSVIGGLATILLVAPFKELIATYVLGSSKYSDLLYLSFVTLFVANLHKQEKTILRAQHRSTLFTWVSVLYAAVAIGFNIYFLAWRGQGAAGIFYSTLVTSTLFTVYLTWLIFKQTGIAFDVPKLREMVKYGIYFMPAGLASFVLNWADRYFLRAYDTIEAVGLYALGYKISMIVVLLIAVPFNQIWHSYIFEVEKQDNAREVYARVATYFLGFLTAVSLGIAVLGREIVIIMAAPSFAGAAQVVPVLAAAMIFFCADNVFQVGLLIKGHSNRLSSARWVAAVLNILLNWLLIPRYGMMGAAVATLLSFITSAVLIGYRAQKVYFVPFEYRRYAHMAAATVVPLGACLLLPEMQLWAAVLAKFCCWLIFPLTLLGTRFFSRAEWAGMQQLLAGIEWRAWRRRAPA